MAQMKKPPKPYDVAILLSTTIISVVVSGILMDCGFYWTSTSCFLAAIVCGFATLERYRAYCRIQHILQNAFERECLRG